MTSHLSAHYNLPNACIVSERKHSLDVWSPAMIQSGIFTFPWIYALRNRMKIGLDFFQAESVTSDTSEAANMLLSCLC